MTRLAGAAAVGVCLAMPALAAEEGTPGRRRTLEVSAAAGLGHVFRSEDQTYGDRVNAGGGIAAVHRSGFTLDLAADRTRSAAAGRSVPDCDGSTPA